MKKIIKIVVICSIWSVFVCSCSVSRDTRHGAAAAFCEGNICIIPPVKLKRDTEGILIDLHQDGGTKMVTIIDANGKSFDLYMYHQLGDEKRWGFYLNGYPKYKGGIRVTHEAEFKRTILNGVLKWDRKSGHMY